LVQWMSIRASRSSFHSLVAVAIGLTCAAALAIGLTVWWLRADAIRNASRDASNLATVLAEQIANSIHSIDLVLTEIQGHKQIVEIQAPTDLESVLRSEDTYQFLTERLSHLQHAELIGVVDKNGRVLNTTQQRRVPPIDVSDRPPFRYFKNNDDKGIFISDGLIERVKGTQVILFCKRINGVDNTFLGMVVIAVKLTYFQNIYNSIASLPDQAFLLLHRDGSVIVRYPDSVSRTGLKMPPESPWHRLVSEGGGQYRSPGYFDDEARLVAVRPVRDYPVVVNLAESETAALAVWRQQAMSIGIGTLLVMLSSAFLVRGLGKQYHKLATSEATLADKARELQGANTKLDAALNNMSQGLVMFDASARLVVCNERYLEMYGLSPEVVRPGATLREILEQRIANGSFRADDLQQYLSDLDTMMRERMVVGRITNLKDGRIISVVNHPIAESGWVATHEDVTEEKRAKERIAYAAHHDALTGLPNRALFCDHLEQELKRVRRGERLAVLYLDVDRLKRVNDTLGHPVGDKLLKGVADRLRDCVRDTDLVARLSGDEFAIIQTSIDLPSDAATLAKRARDAIVKPFDLEGHQVMVDISVGISIAPNDAAEMNELLKTADIALYEAKNTGRGTFCFYEPEMNSRMQVRGKLERDLKGALANGEFELFYQPIHSLKDSSINSFEALLRWHHPERGMVSPAEFIPCAEEMGLIVPIGEWVLRAACAEAAKWPEDIKVAVNVSSIQVSSKTLINVIVGALASSGLSPDRLELEITESVFLKNTFANLATLRQAHELGVQFAMDDFGTGYSSLSYLLSFPFDKIKIDRSFIADLTGKGKSRAIVRAITDLARSLNMCVTAEGVETTQQLEQINMLGCTEAQGYLFGHPRAATDLRQLFLRRRKDKEGITNQVA
jgi:diguanylate cyclase (GGDEF)-like protein/PAS domain S-box-containing protein